MIGIVVSIDPKETSLIYKTRLNTSVSSLTFVIFLARATSMSNFSVVVLECKTFYKSLPCDVAQCCMMLLDSI